MEKSKNPRLVWAERDLKTNLFPKYLIRLFANVLILRKVLFFGTGFCLKKGQERSGAVPATNSCPSRRSGRLKSTKEIPVGSKPKEFPS